MKTVKLDQFDMKSVLSGIISSGGLGPCIAVGVHNIGRKRAWMIHHPNMDIDHPLKGFLEKAINRKNISQVKVYAIGCGIDGIDPNIDNKCKAARIYTEEILKSRFNPDQLIINWNRPGEISELIIDTTREEVYKEVNGEFVQLNNKNKLSEDEFLDCNGNPIN